MQKNHNWSQNGPTLKFSSKPHTASSATNIYVVYDQRYSSFVTDISHLHYIFLKFTNTHSWSSS